MEINHSCLKPPHANAAFWSSLLAAETVNPEVIKEQLRCAAATQGGTSERETANLLACLILLEANAALAAECKPVLVDLLRMADGVELDAILTLFGQFRWYDRIGPLVADLRFDHKFHTIAPRLIDLFRSAPADTYPDERAQFVDTLLGILAEQSNRHDASAVQCLLYDALEARIAPLTAIFAIVGMPKVHSDYRLGAMNRLLWGEYRGEIEQCAPELLKQLSAMLNNPSLHWEAGIWEGVADLLVAIVQSNATVEARADAALAAIALSAEHRAVRKRLNHLREQFSRRWPVAQRRSWGERLARLVRRR